MEIEAEKMDRVIFLRLRKNIVMHINTGAQMMMSR